MSTILGVDNLKLSRLAGGSLTTDPPLFAPTGDILFIISDCVIYVYSTTTGCQIRELEGAEHRIIGMQLELKNEEILVGCTERGELLRWKWSTGQLKRRTQLKIHDTARLTSFQQLNWYGDSETANILILYKNANQPVQWRIYETSKGEKVAVPCTLLLNNIEAIAAAHTGAFKIIAIAQQERLYFINYETWKWIGLTNGLKVPITRIQWHPTEESLAVGDKIGRIMLWREFWVKTTVKNRLYHWHSTPVTSIAFTQSGSGFYSSGKEAVLVMWSVDRPEQKKFVPHISCEVCHIAVSKANVQIAITTLDNGVQILGNDSSVKNNLQEFTYNPPNETGQSSFSVGLRTNPRGNTLVLNGRIGHLQFYSAYTRSLLYNLDVVSQNQLTMEIGRILYNTRVTKAAFNIDWMVTGEVYNDEENFPELRLKFWKYLEESQNYTLNTNIELPHEGGFKAIEFSSAHQVNSLYCATVGEDNTIKIWALEETDNIYKKGKVWFCIAETNYKNMPIESISFSQDGSLLAAGCGNTLCIFKAENLKLKAALNSSPANDGCLSKAEVRFSKTKKSQVSNKKQNEPQSLLQLFTNMLENNDGALLKKMKKKINQADLQEFTTNYVERHKDLDNKQKAELFQRIMELNQLNLFQKILLFQRLGIHCEVAAEWREKVLGYVKETIHEACVEKRWHDLNTEVRRLNLRSRFKAKYRLLHFTKRRKQNVSEVEQNLVPILEVLGLKDNVKKDVKKTPIMNGFDTENVQKMEIDDDDDEDELSDIAKASTEKETIEPAQTMAGIRHVQFAANEYGHLIVACTETRVLIWNLLSLRLVNILKLSVDHLAFDPLTNIYAAFSKNNELHIFQPNVPLPIYQRADMPRIHGATWLPRRYPKRSSIHIDWQAQSHLYFFTESQEIMHLHNPASQDLVDLPPVTFTSPADNIGLRYTTFGTYATQQATNNQSDLKKGSGPLIVGNASKTAVKTLIDMSTHTMPPLSLFCNDFMKSLVKPVDSTASIIGAIGTSNKSSSGNINGGINGGSIRVNGLSSGPHDDSSEEDEHVDEDVPMTNGDALENSNTSQIKLKAMESRKILNTKSAELKAKHEKHKKVEQSEKSCIETQLKRIATQILPLQF